jgi:hypothetical protein
VYNSGLTCDADLEFGVFDSFVPVFSGKRAGLAGMRKGRLLIVDRLVWIYQR